MNSEAKWTQGPWKYNAKTREIGVVDTSDTQSYGMMLVVAYIDEYDHPEYTANAHLIAASPELYEALDMLMDASGPGDLAQLMAEERENIIELLAKARGE